MALDSSTGGGGGGGVGEARRPIESMEVVMAHEASDGQLQLNGDSLLTSSTDWEHADVRRGGGSSRGSGAGGGAGGGAGADAMAQVARAPTIAVAGATTSADSDTIRTSIPSFRKSTGLGSNFTVLHSTACAAAANQSTRVAWSPNRARSKLINNCVC